MTTRDWFLFISTLVIGMFTGLYLYFTTYVPAYISNPIMQDLVTEEAPAWRATVTAYGGCQMMGECPRYEVQADGSVRYQVPALRGEAVVIEETTLPATLVRQLDTALSETDLIAASRATEKTCAHWSDGIDYEIAVDTATGSYMLDTCDTALTQTSSLTNAFRDVFAYLDDPTGYVPAAGAPRGGIGGYIERRLDETFDYDE